MAETTDHEPTDPEDWVDLHGDILFRYARARVRGRDVAEELVQETLLAGLRGRDRFSGRASERTWLVGILRNKIVDHYRKRGRELPASDLPGDDDVVNELFDEKGRWRVPPGKWTADPGALLEREEFRDVLAACMEGLPERQAQVFSLRILDEVSSEEACKVLEVTTTNLGVLLHRARLRLRRCLALRWFERGPEEG